MMKMVNGELVEMTEEEIASLPGPPTPAELLATLAARRYAAEESGTMLGENRLATDDATRAMLHAARTKIAEDPAYVIPAWKFSPGVFAPLDAATIIAAGDAVFDHVQACFANEARLSALILAADTPEALAAIDLDAGWP